VTHLSEDDLVLHYYREDGLDIVAAERHLRTCAQCARTYEALARSLDAVTAPELVDAPGMPALRSMLRGAVREPSSRWPLVLVWLAPLVYPFSLRALFGSARWSEEHLAGIPLVVLTLLWACAGPLLAVLALNRMADGHGGRAPRRLLILGALMAAVSPSLFLVVTRLNLSLSMSPGLWSWYGLLAVTSSLALVRWPAISHSTERFGDLHRLSAVVLTLFVLAHVINQALAFVSLPVYGAMRRVMIVASQQPVSYAVIVGAVLVQIGTGAAMGLKNVRAGALARNLQAVSGWCLAAFLLAHVFLPLLGPPRAATPPAIPFNQFELLATPRAAMQLPFLLLGVAAFLFHLGVYARLAALAYLAETPVRRLSYAGAFVGAALVVTIGLALCGVHLIP
jgi:succinate dehydrogenase/fumarate reductase cytochrome b subunit